MKDENATIRNWKRKKHSKRRRKRGCYGVVGKIMKFFGRI
jgi:hypothetical protein